MKTPKRNDVSGAGSEATSRTTFRAKLSGSLVRGHCGELGALGGSSLLACLVPFVFQFQ
jgi:hypothetical protein